MLTVKQRVQRGIDWLERSRGNQVPQNWRSLIKPETLQFANPDKGPLGQLFGDYLTGLNRLRIIGGANQFGFRSAYKLLGDPAELKKEWTSVLRTDKNWMKIDCGNMFRTIKGIRYWLVKFPDNTIRVEENRNGQIHWFPNSFSSYESCKRFVRKLSSQI